MALPAAVQKQVEEAEALQQQLYAPSPEPANAEQPVEEQVAATETPPSNVVELPRNAEPAPVETPKASEQRDDTAYWKQRFDTVQGVLNAEMPKLHAQLKEQNGQIQQLLAELKEKQTAATDASQDTSTDDEAFAPEFIRTLDRKIAKEVTRVVGAALADFRKDVGAVQHQVGQVQERVIRSDEDKFWADVMTLVPDWASVDSDPRWIEWLDTTPEFAEDTYRELASKAIARQDFRKVAKLVELWRGPAVETPKPTYQAELQRQVVPSTTKSGNTPPTQAKFLTRAEYEAAMDPRNVQRLGQKEADRLESEANLAVAEGRVRW